MNYVLESRASDFAAPALFACAEVLVLDARRFARAKR